MEEVRRRGSAYTGHIRVMADSAGKHPFFDEVTADFTYVRLHGSPRIYYSNYSEADLEAWAARLRPLLEVGRDCYVYFDNTAAGHAPTNALTLEHLLDADGWAIGGGAAAS